MIALGIIVLLAVVAAVLYNRIVAARIRCDEALSGIDVALAKRYQSLSGILATVRGYARHELEVLQQLTKLRSGMTLQQKQQLSEEYDQAERQILGVAEQYPQLKASANYMQLQDTIRDAEEHLQAARRLYNANAAAYNEAIQSFPTCLIAALMQAEPRSYFQASQQERQNITL